MKLPSASLLCPEAHSRQLKAEKERRLKNLGWTPKSETSANLGGGTNGKLVSSARIPS